MTQREQVKVFVGDVVSIMARSISFRALHVLLIMYFITYKIGI